MQVFAKADPRVAQFYETGLVPKELWGFGEDLRKKFHATKNVLLKVQHFLQSRASIHQQAFLAFAMFGSGPSQTWESEKGGVSLRARPIDEKNRVEKRKVFCLHVSKKVDTI